MTAESTNETYHQIAENIEQTRLRIAHAREQSPYRKEVTLMAVTKTVDADRINYAIDNCGIRCIGENRVQELCEKYPLLHLEGVSVHLIGSLQSNKVKYIADKVDLIHSLDSLSLAKEIDRQAKKHSRVIDCLIEINIGEEAAKSGFSPEELFDVLSNTAEWPHVRVLGLMAIPPVPTEPHGNLRYFHKMHQLFIDISAKKYDNVNMVYLSMGMSHDFEDAIAHGANMVRVGTGIFGARHY